MDFFNLLVRVLGLSKQGKSNQAVEKKGEYLLIRKWPRPLPLENLLVVSGIGRRRGCFRSSFVGIDMQRAVQAAAKR